MHSALHNRWVGPVRPCSHGAVVHTQVARLPVLNSPTRRATACDAQRREIEPVGFADVYLAMQERVAANGALPKADGRVMVTFAQKIFDFVHRMVSSEN